MISQSDVQARLRLFRYGLIVIVVVTFLVTWLAQYASFQGLDQTVFGDEIPGLFYGPFLQIALIATGVVAVLMVIVYFVYAQVLKNTVGKAQSEG